MGRNILKYFLAFSYSLGVGILAMFCGPSHALKCYSNGAHKNMRTEVGKIGLEECTTSGSECYEALAQPDLWVISAIFKSGCNDCPYWKPYWDFECKKCTTDLCNNQLADQIRKTHRLCYHAKDDEELGKKTIYCRKGVESCYAYSYINPINRVRYFVANCGSGWPGCKEESCDACKTNLCNVPPDLEQELKPLRQQLLQQLEQGWSPQASADPEQKPTPQPSVVPPKPVSSQANLDWLKNPPPPPRPTRPPPSSNQVAKNESAKRKVLDILEADDDEDASLHFRTSAENKVNAEDSVKDKYNRATKNSNSKSDLDNGSAGIWSVSGVFDWRLHATAAVSLLVVAFLELHAL